MPRIEWSFMSIVNQIQSQDVLLLIEIKRIHPLIEREQLIKIQSFQNKCMRRV